MTPRVTIVRDRYARAWPRHDVGERAHVLPLANALMRAYSTDSHFSQYRTPNGRRLAREAIDHLDAIALESVVFDVDCTDAHQSESGPAPESWRIEMEAKVRQLFEVHPGGFYYGTRGGGRIVYVQREPAVLSSQDDARKWSQQYAVALAYLERRFSIVGDSACADWQRLFRLPHATREPGGRPENWPTIGDATRIGALHIKAAHEDVDAARERSKAFRPARVMDFTPCGSDGSGLLYHALRARGDIIRQQGSNAFIVRCPRESLHSKGCTGDSSTILFLPAAGEQVGAIHCLHGHCSGMAVRDWLRCFTTEELESARRSAGIERVA